MRKLNVPKEFLGAFKRGHRQHSREFIDEELPLKLLKAAEQGCEESRKALLWLTKFNNEYHKGVVKKGDAKALHNTKELRKDCEDRLYRRKVDLYTSVPLVRKLSGR